MRFLQTTLISVFTLGLLIACGEPELSGSQKTEDGGEVSYTVEGNTGQMKFESEEQGTTEVAWGDAAKLSDAFPEDVPVYPGVTVMAASENHELGHFSLQGTSEDAPDKVIAFYKKNAEQQGWALTNSATVGPMNSLSYRKDERIMAVTVMPGQAGAGKAMLSVVTQKDQG